MKFRPKRIRIRPHGGGVWRTVGLLEAAEDMNLVETMPDDTERVFALARNCSVTVTFRDVNPDTVRIMLDIPEGFPLWYRRPQLALPAPARSALPWGDSCYTTAVYAQIDGWPRTVWCMGPVTDLTPSSEGPRGQARGDAYMVRRAGAADRGASVGDIVETSTVS